MLSKECPMVIQVFIFPMITFFLYYINYILNIFYENIAVSKSNFEKVVLKFFKLYVLKIKST